MKFRVLGYYHPSHSPGSGTNTMELSFCSKTPISRCVHWSTSATVWEKTMTVFLSATSLALRSSPAVWSSTFCQMPLSRSRTGAAGTSALIKSVKLLWRQPLASSWRFRSERYETFFAGVYVSVLFRSPITMILISYVFSVWCLRMCILIACYNYDLVCVFVMSRSIL